MKGIIFNLLEQFVTENFGEDTYENILSDCKLKTRDPFVGPGSYPDEDLMALIGGTVEVIGITPHEALQRFGRFCFPLLAGKFPAFVEPYSHPKPFLKSVGTIIHVEVKKLYEDAQPPDFAYDDTAEDRLVVLYRSKRKLCHLMEGLLDGVADFYNSPIQYEQRACLLDGADACEFDLCFSPEGTRDA